MYQKSVRHYSRIQFCRKIISNNNRKFIKNFMSKFRIVINQFFYFSKILAAPSFNHISNNVHGEPLNPINGTLLFNSFLVSETASRTYFNSLRWINISLIDLHLHHCELVLEKSVLYLRAFQDAFPIASGITSMSEKIIAASTPIRSIG
jgi:hypothetical protein